MLELGKLIGFLIRYARKLQFSRGTVGLIVISGILGGASSAAFIAVINTVLTYDGSPPAILKWSFVALCVSLPLFRFVSNFLLIRLTQYTQLRLSLDLCRRILASPLSKLEHLGTPRLLAAITDDINTIVAATSNIPLVLLHLTVVLGCLTFLGWLSWQLLVFLALYMLAGILTYRMPMIKAEKYFLRSREVWDSIFRNYRGLTEGCKELKLHSRRRRAFLQDELEPSLEARIKEQIAGGTIYAAVTSWGQAMFFVLIGLLLFVLPTIQDVSLQTLTGYTLVILYLLTPLDFLMALLPTFARANVAVKKVQSLGFALESNAHDVESVEAEVDTPPFERLELIQVYHSYHREDDDKPFSLGPVDLRLQSGELLFIVGGNGSGKTTLAKLILGLYVPERGEIQLDGAPIDDSNRERYRQLFSALFSDFYLFESLLGLEAPAERIQLYLETLKLEQKVEVRDGRLSTIDLSQGQRKRLALLGAYLEDRPIYLFDEWAADQDPTFKNVFYYELLPELRLRGKTVIVISHDDHYYHVADRIIKLSDGAIELDETSDRIDTPVAWRPGK